MAVTGVNGTAQLKAQLRNPESCEKAVVGMQARHRHICDAVSLITSTHCSGGGGVGGGGHLGVLFLIKARLMRPVIIGTLPHP